MKKLTILVNLMATILACNKQEDFSPKSGDRFQKECFTIKISRDVRINLDCAEKSAYLVKINSCAELDNLKSCHYAAELHFGNQLIESIVLSGDDGLGFFEGNFNSFKFGLYRFINTPSQVKFEIRIYKYCKTVFGSLSKTIIKSEFKNIQIVRSGQNYTKIEYLGPATPILGCEFNPKLPYISCGSKSDYQICLSNYKINQKFDPICKMYTFTPTFKFKDIEVNGAEFDITLPIDYPFNEDLEVFSNCLKFKSEPDLIIYMGYMVDVSKYNYTKWKTLLMMDALVEEEIVKVPEIVHLSFCRSEYLTDCPLIKQRLNFRKEIRKRKIIVDQFFPDDILKFYWTGPNGFNSESKDLENVEYGDYKLKVTDLCCNAEVFKVSLNKN